MNTANGNNLEGRRCSSENITIVGRCDFDQQPKRCFTGILIPVNGNTILNITEQECSRNIKFYICKATSLISSNTVLRTEQDQKRNNSMFTGAVIGGIMGACSILAVLAVLIICKFRSKGNLKPSDAFQKGQTSNLMFSKKIKPDSTNKRNREINELCETGTSRYSVVNNLTKPENMNDTYTDATDGEYDVLHDKQTRTICPTENMYHSHGVHQHEDGSTYDSAAIVKGIQNYGSELYDTSFSEVEGDYSYMSYKSHDQSTTSDIYDKST